MPTRPPQRVYGAVRELDRTAPAMVRRDRSNTLIMWDPRATRLDVVEWCVDYLPQEELHGLFVGLALPFPLPDWTTRRRPAYLFVPRALRLPGDPAFQGGMELLRRQALGLLDIERAAHRADRYGHSVNLQHVDDLARV